MRFLFITILTALVMVQVENKIYSKVISVTNFRRESGWYFLDRITMQPGLLQIQSEITITAKDFRHGAIFQLELAFVTSELWATQSQNKCNKAKYSQQQLNAKASQQIVHLIPLHGQNNFRLKSSLKREITKETALNLVLRDCSHTILKENFGRGSNIEVKLNIILNGEHKSSTESMYSWLLPASLLLGLGTLFFLNYNKEDEDNWIKYLLKISLWIALSATLLKTIGFIIYAYLSGEDYQFFDFMYLLLYSTSDSIIIVLLLLLSFGWTVTFTSTNDFDLYVPLASMLGIINIIMTTINKVTDGDHDKYHIFDSIPAYIMIFFRLVGLVIFAVGLLRTFLKLKSEEKKVYAYFIQLGILGTIYLTYIPASLLLVNLVESHERKEAMFFIVEAGKYAVSLWLGYLSGSKKSVYRNIIEGSFMEKGGKYY